MAAACSGGATIVRPRRHSDRRAAGAHHRRPCAGRVRASPPRRAASPHIGRPVGGDVEELLHRHDDRAQAAAAHDAVSRCADNPGAMSSMMSGGKPSLGSSRISRFEADASACAMSRCCCYPRLPLQPASVRRLARSCRNAVPIPGSGTHRRVARAETLGRLPAAARWPLWRAAYRVDVCSCLL